MGTVHGHLPVPGQHKPWSTKVQGSKRPDSKQTFPSLSMRIFKGPSNSRCLGGCGIGEGWCLPPGEEATVRKILCLPQIGPAHETEPTLGRCPTAHVASRVLLSRAGLEMCPPANPRDTASRTLPTWEGPTVPLRPTQGPGTSSDVSVIVGLSLRLLSPGPGQLRPACPSGCAALV